MRPGMVSERVRSWAGLCDLERCGLQSVPSSLGTNGVRIWRSLCPGSGVLSAEVRIFFEQSIFPF